MNNDFSTVQSDGSVLLRFDSSIYSKEAVKKACYKFADVCSTHIATNSDGQIVVRVEFQEEPDTEQRGLIIQSLVNETLDQDLRDSIKQETEPVRNLILAQAFSKTSLIDSD